MGLLCAKKEILPEDILYPTHDLDDFKGGMTENYVCTQLMASGYTNYYWTSGRGAEVDFIIQRQGQLILIEVKAADHTKAKSLDLYAKGFNPDHTIKLSTKNLGRESGVVSVPLYAAFCIWAYREPAHRRQRLIVPLPRSGSFFFALLMVPPLISIRL